MRRLDFHQEGATFPFGAHVSVVEVDTETGRVTPRRHIAVDDCGRILNPLLVVGQQHGGLAQGVAQALFEEILFDADGQPLTASLADYRMPTAADLFWFEPHNTETPTPMNPLGAKGIGESATVGSTPAVQNAVVDALRPFGVRHVDMPCSPERVWRAIQAGATRPVARAACRVRDAPGAHLGVGRRRGRGDLDLADRDEREPDDDQRRRERGERYRHGGPERGVVHAVEGGRSAAPGGSAERPASGGTTRRVSLPQGNCARYLPGRVGRVAPHVGYYQGDR